MKKTSLTGIVLTFPILAGKVEAWRRFCQELSGSRLNQYESSRQRLGITHERMALMESSYGATAVTTIEASDAAQALGQLITSDRSFDVWYRERLRELHGIDLSGYEKYAQSVSLPRNQKIHFEWEMNSNDGADQTVKVNSRKEKDHEHQSV